MRSARTLITAGLLATALTACGPFGDDSSSTSSTKDTGSNQSASTPADSGTIEVPEIPEGKITAKGDLCKLIPTDAAAEVLGQPKLDKEPWKTEMDPAVLDTCNLSYTDGDGNFMLNVFVRTGGVETLKLARQILATQSKTDDSYKVSEHEIAGYDEAFYAHREGNLRKGDLLYVANGSFGKQDEARTMAFLTMLANSVS